MLEVKAEGKQISCIGPNRKSINRDYKNPSSQLGRAAYWRGSPEATKKREFLKLVNYLRPSPSKDVFFDLGCGYGNPCIWIADWVKWAFGFETYVPRYRRARMNVEKSRLINVSILRKNFE
jgi:tRNA G46 methylase TrmB